MICYVVWRSCGGGFFWLLRPYGCMLSYRRRCGFDSDVNDLVEHICGSQDMVYLWFAYPHDLLKSCSLGVR